MPSHPDRVRTADLPEGYQFGDARYSAPLLAAFARLTEPQWRAWHENNAERLARRQRTVSWHDLEFDES
jgi:hypothetical protein